MKSPEVDTRSADRRAQDEKIAAEAPLLSPSLPTGVKPIPVEEHLARLKRHPIAVTGIVENGLVRPLDPTVKLREHTRVIIVASE